MSRMFISNIAVRTLELLNQYFVENPKGNITKKEFMNFQYQVLKEVKGKVLGSTQKGISK